MYINVNFESIEEVKEFVKAFGDVGCTCVDQATKAKAKKETKEEVKEVEETKEETKEEVKEVEETKEETKPVEEPKEEVKTVTKEQLTDAFKTKMKAGKSTELKAILNKYGASKVSEVNEEDREQVFIEVEAL